jgi:hypothetical protein
MKLNKAFFFITQKATANLIAKKRPGAVVNIGSMWPSRLSGRPRRRRTRWLRPVCIR